MKKNMADGQNLSVVTEVEEGEAKKDAELPYSDDDLNIKKRKRDSSSPQQLRSKQCFYLAMTGKETHVYDLVFFRIVDENSALWATMFCNKINTDVHNDYNDVYAGFSEVDKLYEDNLKGKLNKMNKMHEDVREYRNLPKLNKKCLNKCSFLPQDFDFYHDVSYGFEYIIQRVATHCSACNGKDLEYYWWAPESVYGTDSSDTDNEPPELPIIHPVLDFNDYNPKNKFHTTYLNNFQKKM